MQAIQYSEFGAVDVFKLVDVGAPVAGPSEVRVQLHFAGISPIDAKLRAGRLRDYFQFAFPKTTGRDGVGVIDQVGSGVEGFACGDLVWVAADPGGAGTYADFVVCTTERVVHQRSSLPDHTAAALFQPGVSAWTAVKTSELVSGGRGWIFDHPAGTSHGCKGDDNLQDQQYRLHSRVGRGCSYLL